MKTHQILITKRTSKSDMEAGFAPKIINIKKGDQITWSNNDVAFHTITSTTQENKIDNIFDSKILAPQKEFSFTFNKKGNFRYIDTIHPWIIGQILVK